MYKRQGAKVLRDNAAAAKIAARRRTTPAKHYSKRQMENYMVPELNSDGNPRNYFAGEDLSKRERRLKLATRMYKNERRAIKKKMKSGQKN